MTYQMSLEYLAEDIEDVVEDYIQRHGINQSEYRMTDVISALIDERLDILIELKEWMEDV